MSSTFPPRIPERPLTEDQFTADEVAALGPYFTNTDRPVFAISNLPETVKGALFARYSRSAKSLRRLFLDEFIGQVGTDPSVSRSTTEPAVAGVGTERADKLFARVLSEYGDDSVAQLGGAHVACEGVSNVLTKVLEWGRLMAYLEQSTRYVPYTNRPHGRWKYHIPAELGVGSLHDRFVQTLDFAFDTYAKWIPEAEAHFRQRYPKAPEDSDAVYRSVIRAKALDTLRGLLPAATTSNVGLFGTGQAYEALLMRMFAHPLEEARTCAAAMLSELRQVIPAFLSRVDQPARGARTVDYLATTRATFEAAAMPLLARPLAPQSDASGQSADRTDDVTLTDFDPDGELKVIAAALYTVSDLSDHELLTRVRAMSVDERRTLLQAYIGDRTNRRHKPGRALERAQYRFDIVADYGAFRDLQRHRLLTLEWQPLSARHGFVEPAALDDIVGIGPTSARADWLAVMDRSAELYEALVAAGHRDTAPYAVVMAYRVRFYMDMNAREAMHVIELRTTPQGHPAYRRVCQRMHTLIRDVAGHRALAAAMQFADHSEVELERLEAERGMERKRRKNGGSVET